MDALEDITRFIFIGEADAGEAPFPAEARLDAIFIPGSASPEPMELAVRLWKRGLAPVLVPSGKFSIQRGRFEVSKASRGRYPESYRTECEFYRQIAVRAGVPDLQILKENRATYTMQNAVFSRELTDAHGLIVHRAAVCCKSYHARRAFLYYQYAFPQTEFRVFTVDVAGVSRENWYRSAHGTDIVMGELSRCGHQIRDLIPALAARKEAVDGKER